ncbi:MAG: hypothetical protein R3B57_02685 [Phycisphaerales bacterium]
MVRSPEAPQTPRRPLRPAGSIGLLVTLVLVALVVSTFKRSAGYEDRVRDLVTSGELVGKAPDAVDLAIGSHIRDLGDGVHTINTRDIRPWSGLVVEVEVRDGVVTRAEVHSE